MNVEQQRILPILEDLYTAFLLGGAKKSEQYSKHYVIKINRNRLNLIDYYIDRNKLNGIFNYDLREVEEQFIYLYFKNNVVFQRLVNDWTFDNKIIAISPSLLNMNVYMLWISLFAEQRKNFIRIPNSHLSNEAALTLANLFEDYTGISITTNNLQFALYGIKEIVVLALKLKRPHYEIYRFLEFLSDNEYTKLIHLLSNERFGLRRVNFEYR